MRYLGAHVSAAGGLPRALGRGEELGCTAIQLFLANPNQWKTRELGDEEVATFRRRHRESGIGPIVAHSAYLINLCAVDRTTLKRSRRRLGEELDGAARLGLHGLVVHPGAHMGAGEEAGLEGIAASIRTILSRRDPGATRLLLEVTAGQGTVLGHRLEQLEEIVERLDGDPRIGICLDACHLFAAGYPVHTRGGVDDLLSRVEERFGLDRLGCVHLNDSRHPLDSRRDRHANLDSGEIGADAIAHLAAHPAVADVPLILETPRGEDGAGHRRDLACLRGGDRAGR